MFLRGV
ncbi:unnamed protein product, partial [Allacma fusca]